jgi:transposase
MNVTTVGIDIAKHVFELHGVDSKGKTVLKKTIRRDKLSEFMANLPACVVGLEACGGSHHWARKFKQMGHEMKLMTPQFVKPYVKSNKNDSHEGRLSSG